MKFYTVISLDFMAMVGRLLQSTRRFSRQIALNDIKVHLNLQRACGPPQPYNSGRPATIMVDSLFLASYCRCTSETRTIMCSVADDRLKIHEEKPF